MVDAEFLKLSDEERARLLAEKYSGQTIAAVFIANASEARAGEFELRLMPQQEADDLVRNYKLATGCTIDEAKQLMDSPQCNNPKFVRALAKALKL